ncbi:hypothetical protein Tco_0759694 [Tanacetum coccineum]
MQRNIKNNDVIKQGFLHRTFPYYPNYNLGLHQLSLMPEIEIFHKPETGIFDEASYDEEGVITDFNSLPTEIESGLLLHLDWWPRGIPQEEGIDYDEVFAPVARIESISAITTWGEQVAFDKDGRSFDVDVPLCNRLIHLNAVKRIFKYLKGKPNLGLWYPRESPFDLEAFSDSDYGGSNLDRKSTTGGCQFLGQRLISWQCKKQTIVATSTTEAEYVAAANCCGQVLWVQNQLLDYGFNFMNTKIHIDNEDNLHCDEPSIIILKDKDIEIRHHSKKTVMRRSFMCGENSTT